MDKAYAERLQRGQSTNTAHGYAYLQHEDGPCVAQKQRQLLMRARHIGQARAEQTLEHPQVNLHVGPEPAQKRGTL